MLNLISLTEYRFTRNCADLKVLLLKLKVTLSLLLSEPFSNKSYFKLPCSYLRLTYTK